VSGEGASATQGKSLERALKDWALFECVHAAGTLFVATLPLAALAGEPGQEYMLKRLGALFDAVDRAYAAGYEDEGRDLWVLGGVS